MSVKFWIKEGQMQPPVAVLRIGGWLGVNQAKELLSQCASLRYKGYLHLILNMSEVTFIASSGIGALVVLSGEMKIKGGSTNLVSVSQPVMRVIELLNLGKFVTIEKSEEKALAKLEVKQ